MIKQVGASDGPISVMIFDHLLVNRDKCTVEQIAALFDNKYHLFLVNDCAPNVMVFECRLPPQS